MSEAGQRLVAGRVPGELIDEAVVTSDSAVFTTTETVVASITVPLVSGRTYRIVAYGKWASTNDNDDVRAALREDGVSGTAIQSDRRELDTDDQGTFGQTFHMEARHTATSTGNKTFVVTGERDSGTGDCRLEAAASRPTFLSVYYHRG